MNRGVVIGVAIVAIAAAGGFIAQRMMSAGEGALKLAPPSASPSAAADEHAGHDAEEAPQAPSIPETVPDISLADRTGKPRSLSEWKGQPVIKLHMEAYLGAPESYDAVRIAGNPPLQMKLAGGVHGDVATASITVNSIPKVLQAPPGLRTMRDMTLPSYFGG